ncbi:carbohydrate ABC transporter permease [Microbacterium sp.]|uniref:carbohydrate ABC transporter permease n=1 Tax=Microbacterium sp. TaxID=51671 RepID=UPI001AC3EE31|nr:carbohydrate ABC transporter permease [Microbacterium sp.]MBN9190604.1 carbohydrate ABC transporter permease [Microbacterium sp.]MBN9193014.1 carbohydrate ABC transporter permease [Microbacterium sp.]
MARTRTLVHADGTPVRVRRRRLIRFNLFDVFVVLFTVAFALVCFYPMWYVFLASITPYSEFIQNQVMLWFPRTIDFHYYVAVFSTDAFANALFISVAKTVLGTALSVLVTSMMAYAVSKTHIRGMSVINALVVFTLLFSGGLIPEYMLYRDLGLLQTFWVMVLPSVLSVFYFIIMRNYFAYAAPKELEEAAMIDGASEFRIFFQVILPTAKPMLAAIALFIAVYHWNDFYSYMMFVGNQPDLQPFAWILRRTLVDPSLMNQIRTQAAGAGLPVLPPIGLRMATIIIAMLPILLIYPFLQRFFSKGMMLGAIKE